jgi:hypothetical protein
MTLVSKQTKEGELMRKIMSKKTLTMCVAAAALFTVPLLASAADKLVVQNGSQEDVFAVGEDGTMRIDGQDANNPFSYKIIGHTGGSSHTQTATDLADSRLTVMAAEAADYAPRLQMTGPQDVAAGVRGWMIFDYGSGIYDLPNAAFVLRHFGGSPGDYVNMLQTNGRSSISFPTGNVGIGTTSPGHLLTLAGGAYSDGATWSTSSSRELKKNIQEISADEAITTVENLKPVAFNYKKNDQEQHVGFIAEEVPELVANNDRKSLDSMDITAVLTKVVQEQQKMIKELQAKIGDLETSLQFKKDKDVNLAQASSIQAEQ